MYLATVFMVPEAVYSRLHKAIFTFLWKGRNELVSRETCKLQQKNGGLQIPDIRNKVRATRLKWIKQITDKRDGRMWIHYARYWLGTALSTIRDDWQRLRSALKPAADPTTIPQHYKTIKETIQQYKTKFVTMEPEHFTTRNLSTIVQERGEQPRAIIAWKREFSWNGDFRTIWTDLWKSLSTNKEKEIVWKVYHRVLPTRTYLAKWGLNIPRRCPYCPMDEDTDHALFKCNRAVTLWQQMSPIIKSVTEKDLFSSLRTFVPSEGLPVNSPARDLLRYILNMVVVVLWSTRNKRIIGIKSDEDL